MKSVREQMLEQGLINQEDLPEVRRAAAEAARPAAPDKESPPPFDAPPRGVVVRSGPVLVAPRQRCIDCGGALPTGLRRASGTLRCAECAADPG